MLSKNQVRTLDLDVRFWSHSVLCCWKIFYKLLQTARLPMSEASVSSTADYNCSERLPR